MADNPYSTFGSQSSSGGENAGGLRVMYSSFSNNLQDILGTVGEPTRVRSLSQEQIDQLSMGNMCAICLENMDEENGEVFVIPICKHKFHESCLRRWKKEKATCPSCRGVMPEELGPTNEHIWIGNRQLRVNSRPPPRPTFCHIFWTVILTPLGIIYSLLIVVLFIVFELKFLLLLIIFVLAFAQWYAWVEAEDVSLFGRICHSISSIILFPFLFIGVLLMWLSNIRVLLSHLGSFYKKLMTCQCRWSDIYSETVVPTLRDLMNTVQTFINDNESE